MGKVALLKQRFLRYYVDRVTFHTFLTLHPTMQSEKVQISRNNDTYHYQTNNL